MNLQFSSQKKALLVADCSVKTISVLFKIILSTLGKTVRVIGYDLSVVVLTVSSVRFSVSEILLHLEKPFLITCPLFWTTLSTSVSFHAYMIT